MNIKDTLFLGLAIIAASPLLTGCQDEIMESAGADGPDTLLNSAIIIDGEDCFYTISKAGKSISTVKVDEDGFITLLDNNTVYFEQNDEYAPREASVEVVYSDGTAETLSFRQKPYSRAVDGKQFMRHHGIGYSYNAVEGHYCNLRDFRCQILNRAMLEKVGDEIKYNFVIASSLNELQYSHAAYSSLTDYIQNTNIYAGVSGNIVLFSGDATMSCALFEEGVKTSYILKNEARLNCAEYFVDGAAVQKFAKKYPSMLTSSFRHAVSNLNSTVDIDNFIYKYGTHVVVYSKLGARLTLEVQVDTHKFEFKESAEAMADVSLATLFKYKSESSSQTRNYEILRNGSCRLNILGGDLSIMDKVIDLNNFNTDGTSEEMVDKWIKSVNHNDDDLASSNVEMIDIEVIPIWELIPDEAVAKAVEMRVTGNAALLAETLGNKNLINTSFTLGANNISCKVGGVKQTFSNPDVIDVIVANRHVATMCHEYVPEIAGKDKIWVAYPIYEGHVSIDAGLTIHNGKSYGVCWNGQRFDVEMLEDNTAGMQIFMNLGALSTHEAPNLEYQESNLILGCERPGGIKPDGSLGGNMVRTYKHFGHFYLLNNNTRYDNLPGWSWMSSVPKKEYDNYKDFFPLNGSAQSSWKTSQYPYRMWRDNDYVYIYNPKEVSYD